MTCIGTAGHIDHGKSTLVKALTGIDPDRLTEEKVRGMTIDLGFAWLTLPDGREVSLIDVPGHEGFIKNMLAGVGGIDVALLVVAADEGAMPQTREHLAILDLLQVRSGVVALTKADLVDEEWLALVSEEIATLLQPTSLAGAPIVPVSAISGQGIAALLAHLQEATARAPERPDRGRPRLPVDRVFTLAGFGTIVTGTLIDGCFRPGQEVEILPRGLKARIRGLQRHRQAISVAQPGERTALNLAGIAHQEVERGDVVTLPGLLQPTTLIDVRLRLLADAPRPLSHNALVDFYCGAQVVPATVRLLEDDELLPGESTWAQLRLHQPTVVERHDRFIVRIPSPSLTIGGGAVLDAHPRYHRRRRSEVLHHLETLAQGSPEAIILTHLEQPVRRMTGTTRLQWPAYETAELARLSNLTQPVTQQALETLLTQRRVRRVGTYWFALSVWQALSEEALRLVRDYHVQFPLRSGLSKEEWRSRLHLPPRLAMEVFETLRSEGLLTEAGSAGLLRLPEFLPTLSAEQQRQVERLIQVFRENPFMPPTRGEAEALIGEELVNALLERGELVKMGDGTILFLREAYERAVALITSYLQEHGTITVAQARDLLGTTRKYVLPLLEHMDEQRITRRVGDLRVRLPQPAGT
ncbi:selenocysteine-specific translation elongation factor [Thermogemmatispora tikiterensis]|uniref:Selenocysteine-specific elongation factor n=1 Tax=Thermogemmatispora tikiterensis TaxID=1825093 RepID=A0A328VH94_9CHLR|nr:selenocysteine-specific translation elongation factor [Thermogemmatispora tikiterensis]RAQ96251.1 selenocysteine-specific translation elongation factor [Thermogemmatispora tikiterensis]